MFDGPFVLVLGLALFLALGGGFAVGLWAYAKLYENFMAKQEEKRGRAVALAKQEQARRILERKDMVQRVREMMVNQGAPEEHVSEEIERILGTGPGN